MSLSSEITEFYDEGVALYESDKNRIKQELREFVSDNEVLDGAKIEASWFPQIQADIFISHAHQNRRIAISLAGWLNHLGVRAFVDSSVWGNADELLRLVDNNYSYMPERGSYSYEKRNRTTSHVHMMLSTALLKMIDRCECLFFINTPKSISTEGIVHQTESPWIYAELSMSELIRSNIPARILKEEARAFSKAEGGEVEMFEHLKIMTHNVNLKHLRQLSVSTLSKWAKNGPYRNPQKALDELYTLVPIIDILKG